MMTPQSQTDNVLGYSPTAAHSDYDDDAQDDFAFAGRGGRGCCFCFPCFGSAQSSRLWERIGTTPSREKEGGTTWSWEWWDKGLKTLKKVREWSELVAGPKWKTFIRRFNKGRGGIRPVGKFQYDPSSYALNFDDGPAQNGYLVEDDDRLFRDFSSRYAAIPLTAAKSVVEMGKDSNIVHGNQP